MEHVLGLEVESALLQWHVKHYSRLPPAHAFPSLPASALPQLYGATATNGAVSGDATSHEDAESEAQGDFVLELSPEWAERLKNTMERRTARTFDVLRTHFCADMGS